MEFAEEKRQWLVMIRDLSTNHGFKSFTLKTENILPDYVYWWLKGNKDLAESFASGTTFLELSGSKAKQLPLPIAPLDQQKRIVAEIEKQFSRLDEAVANLKRYKAAVLKAAVEGKLTEEWSKQHPDVEPAFKTPQTHPRRTPPKMGRSRTRQNESQRHNPEG